MPDIVQINACGWTGEWTTDATIPATAFEYRPDLRQVVLQKVESASEAELEQLFRYFLHF